MPGTMSGILSPILLQKFGLVLVCMVTARNAAMAFNRYLDRHFDALNPRTAIREIPAGILSASSSDCWAILRTAMSVKNAMCGVMTTFGIAARRS